MTQAGTKCVPHTKTREKCYNTFSFPQKNTKIARLQLYIPYFLGVTKNRVQIENTID